MIKPSEAIKSIVSQISKLDKIAFFSVWIIGLCTHLRIFMQDIPNHDGMDSLCFDQNMITSGRWLLSSIASITSDYTLPWLIGCFSLLYLSIAAMFLCRFLQVKESYSVALISSLMVAYPTLVSNFAYLFTADAYVFAIMLSILAVYMVEKSKNGFIFGGIMLGCSMGIYQAYLSLTMVLSLYGVCRIWLMKKKNHQKRKVTIQYIGMGIVGSLIYFMMLQILLWVQQTQLSGYQGIGIENEYSMLEKLVYIYQDFISYTLKGNVFITQHINIVSMGALLFISGILSLIIVYKKKVIKDAMVCLCGIVAIVIAPICFNSMLLISPQVSYHALMRYQWVCFPILAITIIDRGSKYIKDNNKQAMVQWCSLLLGLVLIIQYINISHIGYFNLEKKYEKTYAYILRLLEEMEETPGYYHGMEVAMIGVVGDEYLPSTDLTLGITDGLIGVNGDYLFYRADNYQKFIKYYFGVTIELVDINRMPEIVRTKEYQGLNTFPQMNSMKVVDDILYIKLEN